MYYLEFFHVREDILRVLGDHSRVGHIDVVYEHLANGLDLPTSTLNAAGAHLGPGTLAAGLHVLLGLSEFRVDIDIRVERGLLKLRCGAVNVDEDRRVLDLHSGLSLDDDHGDDIGDDETRRALRKAGREAVGDGLGCGARACF
jgi:hypothetical protein